MKLDVLLDEMKADIGIEMTETQLMDVLSGRVERPSGSMEADAVAEDIAKLQSLEDEYAAVLAGQGKRAVTGIDAPDALFDRSEVIGEGKQAGLDIAIDETARKTEPFAAPPEKGPAQMPGQTEMPAAEPDASLQGSGWGRKPHQRSRRQGIPSRGRGREARDGGRHRRSPIQWHERQRLQDVAEPLW